MFTPGGQPTLLEFGGVYGGGKGGSAPQAPSQPIVLTDPVNGKTFVQGNSPFYHGLSAQDQLNAEIEQRKQEEFTTSQDTQRAADAKTTQQQDTFNKARQSSYDQALQDTMRSFTNQGVDPNAYMASYIQPALQKQLGSIQNLDPNPSAAFPTSLGDTIVNQAVGAKRTGMLNTYNQTFTPNYATNALPDSLTGQYAGQIVNEQFDPLTAQLTNAQKRGTLTQPGYDAALAALNQKKSAAMSNVTNLGQGILATDRTQLGDYISGGRSDINAATLGGNVDPASYTSGAQSKVQGFQSDFGGALRNAVGGTKFADIQDLINAGGAVQGANNPTAANPAGGKPGTSPAFQPDDVLANQKRGLGNQGSF